MIDERGFEFVKIFLEELGGWLVIYLKNKFWDEMKFNFNDLLVKLKFYNNKIFVD